MKNYIKTYSKLPGLFLLLLFIVSGAIFQACTKDTVVGGGTPTVIYIRITDPLKSDSLITHAFMGKNVAIMGENLQNVTEVWFNDQSAKLNTSFITSTNIIVTIPNVIPETVTNEIKLVMRDKTEFTYPFGVDVPAPLISSMLCEYVKEGETAVLQGNFFINDPSAPLKVFFPGNIEGVVLSVSLNEVKVKVPAGVGSGPMVVKSIYGSSRSTFYFRDDRNIFLNFDELTSSGSWRSGTTRKDASSLDRNYVMLKGELGDNAGAEDYSGGGFVCELWSDANGRPEKNFFTGSPADYLLKFEANVKAWSGAYLNICWGPWKSSVGPYQNQLYWSDMNARGLWRPWEGTSTGSFKTDGWITVTIPMADMKYNKSFGSMTFDASKAGSMTLWMKGPAATKGGTCKMEVYFDNFRIVPKK
ncbi:MAG: glycan-binding surface protein [Bacteroidota bacterium]|nr:glycan-binding surface protein [Bacteroidota bacterium]